MEILWELVKNSPEILKKKKKKKSRKILRKYKNNFLNIS